MKLSKLIPIQVISVILIGIITQNIVMFRGGMRDGEYIRFPSMHDTMWNIALTGELTQRFPPQHPGMSGERLMNNHYFYPLILAITHNLTGISLVDLYFRIGPVIVSLLFGLSLYLVSTLFTPIPFFQALTVFLGYFSGNLSYILPLFYGSSFNWQGNTFLADQPFDQLINPYSVLGFAFMLFSFYLADKIISDRGGLHLKKVVLFPLISGSLYGFKSFGGIILVLSLTVTSLLFAWKYPKMLIFTCLTLLIFLPVFFLITEPSIAGLRFAPGWLLTEVMVKKDGLNLPGYAQVEDYYLQIHNLAGIFKIKMMELAVYLTGNLGVRVLGMVMLISLVWQKKSFVTVYMFLAVMFSISIPLLFNLGANAHNIVQFTPYSLVILALLSGVFLEKIYHYIRLRKNNTAGLLVIFITVILSIPVNIKNIYTKLAVPNDKISIEEMKALDYIKNKSDKNSIILINPAQFTEDPIYVSALGERRVYLASENYARQTNRDPNPRLKLIEELFAGEPLVPNDNISPDISYIYLRQPVKGIILDKLAKSGWIIKFENSQSIILSE